MNTPRLYCPDMGPKWSYKVAIAGILITLGIFLSLPLLDMLVRQKKRLKLRPVSVMEIRKTLPRIPPPIKKRTKVRKPKLAEPRQSLAMTRINAALSLEPGFGDFSLNFGPSLMGGVGDLVFDISVVDQPSRGVFTMLPVYPLAAKLRNVKGRVVLAIVVNADGTVDRIAVQSASPVGVFEQAAINAVKKWRFKPGTRRGKPVATRVIQPLEFSLEK